jgi:predicted enzyme related to lactoylglutathione lyase
MKENPVCFWELASYDAEKTVDFLRKLFAWDLSFDSRLGFHTVDSGEQRQQFDGGGVFTLSKARLPFLTLYVRVADIQAKARQVEELGGAIVEPPFEIPGGARICLFNEPSGVTLAMIQAAAEA